MLSAAFSDLFASVTNGLSTAHHTLAGYIHIMASAFSGLLSHNRVSRPESNTKGLAVAVKEVLVPGDPRAYPGSLHRHQRSIPSVTTYRSMLDVEDAPALRPIAIPQEESMEDWVVEKLSQASQKHTTTSSDWADILCFYTATNGAPLSAPTRASPAPVPNGKPVSPEVPQSVTSADPKIAAQQANDMRNIVRRKLTGYVGFANLPNQWHRKSVRKGFNFNVMVVGKFRLLFAGFTLLTNS
jgi:septin 7